MSSLTFCRTILVSLSITCNFNAFCQQELSAEEMKSWKKELATAAKGAEIVIECNTGSKYPVELVKFPKFGSKFPLLDAHYRLYVGYNSRGYDLWMSFTAKSDFVKISDSLKLELDLDDTIEIIESNNSLSMSLDLTIVVPDHGYRVEKVTFKTSECQRVSKNFCDFTSYSHLEEDDATFRTGELCSSTF